MARSSLRLIAPLLTAVALAGCQSGMGSLIQPEDDTVGFLSELGSPPKAQGKVYYAKGDFGLAEKSFTAAIRKQPGDAEAWLGLAATLDRLGRFDRADQAYDRAIAIAGRRPEVLNNIGYSYFLRGEHARARAILQEAAAAAPKDATIRANLAMLGKA